MVRCPVQRAAQELLGGAVLPCLLQHLGEDVHGLDVLGLQREHALAELRRLLQPAARLHAQRGVEERFYLLKSLHPVILAAR